jgi:hypothetical protein
MLRSAMGLLTRNVASLVRAPPIAKRAISVFDRLAVEFIEAAKSHRLGALSRLQFALGFANERCSMFVGMTSILNIEVNVRC